MNNYDSFKAVYKNHLTNLFKSDPDYSCKNTIAAHWYTPAEPEHIIACTETLTVWSFYPSQEAAEAVLPEVKARYLKDAEQALDFHKEYGHRDPGYWLKQADTCKLKADKMKVMLWTDYELEKANQYLSRPITEVSQADYDEALEVLPPVRFGINRGVRSFFMCEFWSGNYTDQYAKSAGRYYTKLVDFSKPDTWITFDMISSFKQERLA